MEKTIAAWKVFRNIQQQEKEDFSHFVQRYENAVINLKNIKIPSKILAIQLLEATNLSSVEKTKLLTAIKSDDQKLYESWKEAIQTIENSPVEEKTAEVGAFQSNKDAIGIRMWIDIPNDFPWRKCLSDYNGVLASTECHLYR